MPIQHHIQKEILRKLVYSDSSRFSELRPKEMDGNIFTYHLNQLISQGYVKKRADGRYELTALGKSAGIVNKLSNSELLSQAHSVLFLAIRNKDGKWLLRQRNAQPMFKSWGFIHTEPLIEESIVDSASHALAEKAGIAVSLKPCGAGYIRLFRGEELESFTHFTILTGVLEDGKLSDEELNRWFSDDEMQSVDLIPSMNDLITALKGPESFFFSELKYQI